MSEPDTVGTVTVNACAAFMSVTAAPERSNGVSGCAGVRRRAASHPSPSVHHG